MPLNLASVSEYVKGTRRLLQDKVRPYRYSDVAVIAALNLALLEGRRLRPDIFICRYGVDVPQYEAVSGDEVPVDGQFRVAFLYGIAAHVLLADEEDVQDTRSNTFEDKFHDMLVGVRPRPIAGGTPTPQKAGAGKAQE